MANVPSSGYAAWAAEEGIQDGWIAFILSSILLY